MSVVAIQGMIDSYSYLAARAMLGSVDFEYCNSFDSALASVRNGIADKALIPVFNSTIGAITTAVEALSKIDVTCLDSTEYEVKHVLAGCRDSSIEQIETVYSHPAAIEQCRHFIRETNDWETKNATDTAGSIRKVTELRQIHVASICGTSAAVRVGAKILAEDIADKKPNITTFKLIGRQDKC